MNNNSNIFNNTSQNQSTISNGQRDPNSLGLEKHVRHVFMQTQTIITALNNELEDQKKNNEELNWKLTDLTTTKNNLNNKNKQLELDLKEVKQSVDENLKIKNDQKAEIGKMKKQLQEVNDDWENKKKELLHQINQLKEEQFKLEDEKNREKVAFDQATKQYVQKIDSIKYSISSTNNEITKYDTYIQKLKGREKFSMDTIMNETYKFKEFLESQVMENPTIGGSSVTGSKIYN
ncbi:hypothetical protein PPERSA_12252 [Pseudocohnilembus persalinus]|uniref:Uncharacterized protein n=1 Tax=Pseudocohnilembus persalinus TaxID=266149 RepID=A0A0V0R5J8_PSEPJ|nr:hypothetical protein PPERSA_12252 [Pseudocohnilembus persalinus]|eukprot:KRX09509.1 hypothetical protein PPERSA_12252 [Pseudocohnilembus persalinus]